MNKDVKYYLEQWPKNKPIDDELLSNAQLYTRAKSVASYTGELKRCGKCGIEQPITEFYFRRNRYGKKYRMGTCRDCILKADGVIEIGKIRFSQAILKKGFRRCSVCQTIKPLTDFTNQRGVLGEKSFQCYDCSHKLSRAYIRSQIESVGDFYVRQYAKSKYGQTELTSLEYEKYRNEILESRKPKYFIDGKSFQTKISFAEYILSEYNIPITTTEARLTYGYSESDCKIPEAKFRARATLQWRFGGTTIIRVVDTITRTIYEFQSANDPGLLKMFSTSAINKAIKTGEKTRVTKLSKHPNPCLIERIVIPIAKK